MKRVKLLCDLSEPGRYVPAGSVAELPAALADQLLRAGVAVRPGRGKADSEDTEGD